jgi:hypothetical protein
MQERIYLIRSHFLDKTKFLLPFTPLSRLHYKTSNYLKQ